MYIQTGDVLYHESAIPKGSKKVKGSLIHQGNDHKHTISGEFQLFKNGEDLFIQAKKSCKLLHKEHKTIPLPKGTYKKGIVMEYDHWLEESRQVID